MPGELESMWCRSISPRARVDHETVTIEDLNSTGLGSGLWALGLGLGADTVCEFVVALVKLTEADRSDE